ncbi:MAG: cell wall-binding repeat-containing protein, partial [Coriobacteriales bacterium]
MSSNVMERKVLRRAMAAAIGMVLATAALCLLPSGQAQAATSDLQFVGISGAGVSGNTVWVRDGDTNTVTLTVRNTTGSDLEFVSMTSCPSFAQAGGREDLEPVEFPRMDNYGRLTADVTNAEWDSILTVNDDQTVRSIRSGFTIPAGKTATFDLKISSGYMSTGQYSCPIQLGKKRSDYEKVTEYIFGQAYDSWGFSSSTVEDTYSQQIPLTIRVYNQSNASIRLEEDTGWINPINDDIGSEGFDFGTISLDSDDEALRGAHTLSVYNSSPARATDDRGNTTDITVSLSGESADSSVGYRYYGPFYWGNISSGYNTYLYDLKWAPLPPAGMSEGGGTSYATYSVILDARYLVEGTYTGYMVVGTIPHKLSVVMNDTSQGVVEASPDGQYRVPVKVTLTGVNPRLATRATNLVATGADSQVELTWQAGETPSGSMPDYSVYRREGTPLASELSDPDSIDFNDYELLDEEVYPDEDGHGFFLDTTAENGKTYTYTVISGNPFHGYPAAPAQATPDPSFPTQMAPPQLDFDEEYGYIQLTWKMAEKYGGGSNDGSALVDHFKVYKNGRLVAIVDPNARVEDINHWVEGTPHTYTWTYQDDLPIPYNDEDYFVTAVSKQGIESYESNHVQCSSQTEKPTILSHDVRTNCDTIWDDDYDNIIGYTRHIIITPNYQSKNRIAMVEYWRCEGTNPPNTAEEPYRKTVGDEVVFDDADVEFDKNYSYALRITDNESNQSDIYYLTAKAPLSNDVHANHSYSTVYVTWTTTGEGVPRAQFWPDGVASYEIHRVDEEGHDTLLETYTESNTPDKGVVHDDETIADLPDGSYTYRVDRVLNGIHASSRGHVFVLDTTPVDESSFPTLPDAPTLTARVSGGYVILNWTPATTGGAPEGFHIYRKDADEYVIGQCDYAWDNGYGVDWGNNRYLTIQDGSARSFIDPKGSSSGYYYQHEGTYKELRTQLTNLSWLAKNCPHEYYITAYNQRGESAPSKVIVFPFQGDGYYSAGIPDNNDQIVPSAPKITKAWIEIDDSSTFYRNNVSTNEEQGVYEEGGWVGTGYGYWASGTLRVAFEQDDTSSIVDTYKYSFNYPGYNYTATRTIDAYKTMLDPTIMAGTSTDSSIVDNTTVDISNIQNYYGQKANVTVTAVNGAGEAVSEQVEATVCSFPLVRVRNDNGPRNDDPQVWVEWTDLYNDAETAVENWEVWRRDEGGTWHKLATLPAQGADKYPYFDTDVKGVSYYRYSDDAANAAANGYTPVEKGWTYDYKVVASCADTIDRPSALRTLTIQELASGAEPGKPLNFTATKTGGQVIFTWDPPADGATPKSYHISGWRKQPGSDEWQSVSIDSNNIGTATSYAWTPGSSTVGTQYRLYVYASTRINVNGMTQSTHDYPHDVYKDETFPPNKSSEVTFTITQADVDTCPTAYPAAPELHATGGDGQVTLTWDRLDVDASEQASWYTIQRKLATESRYSNSDLFRVSADQSSFTIPDAPVENGLWYNYRIWAHNAYSGNGASGSSEVLVMATGPTHDELVAQNMRTEIMALPGPGEVTADDGNRVAEVQEVFDGLSASQRALVGEDAAGRLAAVVEALDALQAEALHDSHAAEISHDQELIDGLPDEFTVTAADNDAIRAARAAYNALPNQTKRYVDTGRLVAAEAAYAAIMQTVADQAAVDRVVALIEALPSTSELGALGERDYDNAKAEILEARQNYRALSDEQRERIDGALVTKLQLDEAMVPILDNAHDAADLIRDGLPEEWSTEVGEVDAYNAEDVRDCLNQIAAKLELVPNYTEYISADLLSKYDGVKAALRQYDNEVYYHEAESTIEMIQALEPTNELTLDDKPAVLAARAAYEALEAGPKAVADDNGCPAILRAAEARIAALEKAAADQAAADVVIAKIDALPAPGDMSVATFEANRDAVAAAVAAYMALTSDQKALVTNHAALDAAEARIVELQVLYDQAQAEAVDDLIDALPASTTIESFEADKALVEAARTAYEGLTDAQKEYVENLTDLEAAEAIIADMEAEYDSYVAAPVAQAIDDLPDIADVTLDDEAAIAAVKADFDKLTPAQQDCISDGLQEKLQGAVDKIAALKVEELIDELPALDSMTQTTAVADKAAVDAARAAYEALTPAQQALVGEDALAALEAAGIKVASTYHAYTIAGEAKALLLTAINNAKAAENGVATSTDGMNVADGKRWTTTAEKKALDNAITAAQKVYDDKSADEAAIKDAKSKLEKATSTYNSNKKLWHRIWGATAPDTMLNITKRFGKTSVAVVTTDASYKDALAASSLAGRYNGLVLMTKKGSLTA